MIAQIFPQDFPRFLSLPVLGALMDRYAGWLHEQQYTWRSTRYELRMAARVAGYLKRRRAVRQIEDLSEQHLDACHRWFRLKFPEEAGGVLALARFLRESGHLKARPLPPPGRAQIPVNAFIVHLREVRGCAPSTILRQGQIADEFLTWLRFADEPDRLSSLTTNDLEGFIRHLSKPMGRVGLQKPLATLRNLPVSWQPTVPFRLGWTQRLSGHESIVRSNSRDRYPGPPFKRFSVPSTGIRQSASVTTPCSR